MALLILYIPWEMIHWEDNQSGIRRLNTEPIKRYIQDPLVGVGTGAQWVKLLPETPPVHMRLPEVKFNFISNSASCECTHKKEVNSPNTLVLDTCVGEIDEVPVFKTLI